MSQFTIDDSWTLFLDRDGVINHEIHMGYVNEWADFTFYEGVKEAFKIFAEKFKYIIIITNQRGVGRGITKPENLAFIHKSMAEEIAAAGGRIDGIYFAPELDKNSPNRKPNTGMAYQAKEKFPGIDFERSIMVGNNISDVEFGHKIGAKTILVLSTMDAVPANLDYLSGVYNSLSEFAQTL